MQPGRGNGCRFGGQGGRFALLRMKPQTCNLKPSEDEQVPVLTHEKPGPGKSFAHRPLVGQSRAQAAINTAGRATDRSAGRSSSLPKHVIALPCDNIFSASAYERHDLSPTPAPACIHGRGSRLFVTATVSTHQAFQSNGNFTGPNAKINTSRGYIIKFHKN